MLDYRLSMAMCLEFNKEVPAQVKPRGIIRAYARPTALVRILKTVATVCIGTCREVKGTTIGA